MPMLLADEVGTLSLTHPVVIEPHHPPGVELLHQAKVFPETGEMINVI